MISPLFVIVILVLLFWYLSQQSQSGAPCPIKCSKAKFTDNVVEGFDPNKDQALSMISDDPTARRANTTGLKSTPGFVNSAFETPAEDSDFNE
jgi:hypothetical protein